MTPRMSFRWSHRETCTTSGASEVNGPAPPRTAEGEPSGSPARRPARVSSCRIRAGGSGVFLGDVGSIEGSMIHTSAPASWGGTYAACENTNV